MIKKEEKVCFIYNPSAGRGGAAWRFEELKEKAKKIWNNPEFRSTRSESDIAEFTRQSADKYDLIVACGGDGTVNKVVNVLAGSGVSLGLIPLGSGNDFAKALDIPHNLDSALAILQTGNIRNIDLIRCKGDADIWCINTLGIGLDGMANFFASSMRRLRGQPVYVIGVLKALYHFRGCRMTLYIDGAAIEKELLMVTVCNGSEEGGGFKVAPQANNSDGYIDLLLIEKMSVARVLWYLPKFMFEKRKDLKGVESIRCKSVSVSSESEVAVHCDGEHLGNNIKRIHAEIKSALMPVVVP